MHSHHISSGAFEAVAEQQNPDFYQSLTTLAYLAAKSRKLRLGVACVVLPFETHCMRPNSRRMWMPSPEVA